MLVKAMQKGLSTGYSKLVECPSRVACVYSLRIDALDTIGGAEDEDSIEKINTRDRYEIEERVLKQDAHDWPPHGSDGYTSVIGRITVLDVGTGLFLLI
jgi:hypothetical protein